MNKKAMKYLILAALFAGCTQLATTTVIQDQAVEAQRLSLSWELTSKPHLEREPWTDALIAELDKNFAVFDSATDTTRICPKYKALTKEQKLKTIGEFFVALAYRESGFDPKSESVDVGNKTDKGSWSVGLFQMSANDSSAKTLKASYENLKDPVINIKVAVEQMRKQVDKEKMFIIPNTSKMRYWAVILENNRFQKINEIISSVKKQVKDCN